MTSRTTMLIVPSHPAHLDHPGCDDAELVPWPDPVNGPGKKCPACNEVFGASDPVPVSPGLSDR